MLAPRLSTPKEQTKFDIGVGISPTGSFPRRVVLLLRSLSLACYRVGDVCDSAAERLQPSLTESNVELPVALRVERFAELEAEAARQQAYVRHGFRVIHGARG